jgi:hypothetical protein
LVLTFEDKLVLAASRLNSTDAELQLIDELLLSVNDWKYFIDCAITNNVGPLVYKSFSYIKNYSFIPVEIISTLKQTYYTSFNRNEIFYKHFHDIVKSFSDQSISVIALKGIFLAEKIYSDIGLRPMSDIDILVRKEDAENCVNILSDSGYVSHERFKTNFIRKFNKSSHLPPLVSGNVSIEIHLRAHIEDCEYNVNIDDYWENARPATNEITNLAELSANDLLQYLCLHLDSHFNNGNAQLLTYCDTAEVLKFYQNEFDWVLFNKSCDEYNCSKNVYRHLFLVWKYFDVHLPDSILHKAKEHIDPWTENLFTFYLQGKKKEILKEFSHSTIAKLEKVKSRGNKVLYLIHDIFPSVTYMKKRYKIRNKVWVPFYYLVRFKAGIMVLFRYLVKSKKYSNNIH